ncbi:preprotein translocase subunit SecG [Candidatus Peregrinibacteria bacterium]|nr:preprotein translocase subunit SecG [Candidatus Peregrinibacteria bacterium]
MKMLVSVLQIVSSIFLILVVLSQSRGGGLGEAFGDSGGFYANKRGAEKVLAIATIVFAIVFLVSSFADTLVR